MAASVVDCDLVDTDLPGAVTLLNTLTEQVAAVTSHVQGLIKRVRDGMYQTDKGLSFLDLRYHLLLFYLQDVTHLISSKTEGRSLRDNSAIHRLLAVRTVLEKMRPIDQKLRYQIDKLVRTAVTGSLGENDPLQLRPRPENLISKLSESEVSEDEEERPEGSAERELSGVGRKYIPPKIAPVHYGKCVFILVLDKCCGNIKEAYSAKAKPPLSNSGLNTVHLIPTYWTVLKSSRPVTKTVHVWTDGSIEMLRGCFLCTDWEIFHSLEVNEATEAVPDYIKFCADSVMPKKSITVYPNNKPCITKDVIDCINRKRLAFKNRDQVQLKLLQKELKLKLRNARHHHKETMERDFETELQEAVANNDNSHKHEFLKKQLPCSG
uniref:Uncharacterized protein n=1 Tax=Lepisosteus oculatus TaxID=7918 RepID=W5LXJ6_LEPOC